MNKCFLVAAILILFCKLSFAQYKVDWGKYLVDSVDHANFLNNDVSEQLAVDVKNPQTNDEYVYVTGRTYARSDFESSCSQNNFYYGAEDAFLAKYDRCGNLQWFRFLGTDNDNIQDECGDFADCLAIDRDPITDSTYIYVGGYSYTNFDVSNCTSCEPCSGNNSIKAFSCTGDNCVFQKNKNSDTDAFIAKYSETGKLIKWSYFGGEGIDYIIGMSVFNHDVFITGTTTSGTSFIPNAVARFDSTLSTQSDAFIAQLDGNLCKLKFFSYMGGEFYERSHSIRCFKTKGNPQQIEFYISGATTGEISDTSYHPLNSYKGGQDDAFLSLWKLNKATGVFKPQWLEYIGGKADDRDREMIIDKKNNAIITGLTQSKNFISSTAWIYPKSNFFDTTINDIKDAFLAKFDLSGNPLWGTYYGGNKSDEARGLTRYAVTSGATTNYIAISGGTKSTDLPVQSLHPPFQPVINGDATNESRDAFVAILTDPQTPFQVQKLAFASYFGGSEYEWNDAVTDYGPDMDLGGNNEIYLTFYTKSIDIENFSSPAYHHNINTGNDNDAFLTKILNKTIPHQYNCNQFNWGSGNKEVKNENFIHDFRLFPNPASDKINLESAQDDELHYEIFNVLGEVLLKGKWAENKSSQSIDTRMLQPGIYLLSYLCRDYSGFKKFVISR